MSASKYFQKSILNHLFNGALLTKPTSYQVGLFSGSPVDDNSDYFAAHELDGHGYSRASFGNTGGMFGSLNLALTTQAAQLSNLLPITFPTATGNWPVITHVGIFDQAGNLIFYNELSTPVTVYIGQTPTFGIGAITIQSVC